MSVGVSGNTILRIVVVLLTVIVERQTGLAALREEILCRIGSELRNETLADKAEISGVTIASVTAGVLVIAAIEAALAIAAVSVTEVASEIAVEIAAVSAIAVEFRIVPVG